jgi:hypothetical protein
MLKTIGALAALLLCHAANAAAETVDAGLDAETVAEDAGAEEVVAASVAPVPEATAAAAPRKKDRALGALEGEPGFEIGGRLGAMWTMRDSATKPLHEFRVTAARLELTWTQWKLVEASISVEASHLLDGDGDFSILRDLYVRIQPLTWLGVRMGQFKKPFSHNELRRWGKLPFVDRGIGNDYLIEHLMYGDRDIGLQLEGRLVESIKLDYAIGAFNGMGKNTAELALDGSKDFAARLEADAAKWISIGVNGSVKVIDKRDLPGFVDRDNYAYIDNPEDYPLGYTDDDFIRDYDWMAGAAWAGGADVGLDFGDLHIDLEGTFGENWWFEEFPYAWTGLLAASYKIKLKKGWPLWLEPALRGEVLTILTSGSEWHARQWQIAPAINLYIGKHVRLMIDGEFVFAEFANKDNADFDQCGSGDIKCVGLWPDEWPGAFADSKRLMVQLLFGV